MIFDLEEQERPRHIYGKYVGAESETEGIRREEPQKERHVRIRHQHHIRHQECMYSKRQRGDYGEGEKKLDLLL